MLQQFNPKNKDILVYVKDGLYPRSEAKVSVFDSSVQGGDSVWEGLRLYSWGILQLGAHLKRLYESAHALGFQNIPSESEIREAISKTLTANGMQDDVHIRLTLTRGEKVTSGMDPRLNQSGCLLIVLAEWKSLVYDNSDGIQVITSSIRRNAPQFLDSKIHHANLLNNILAKMEANNAGADAAVMLDERGFISELNDTNVFFLKDGELKTPTSVACLPGISRRMTLETAHDIQLIATQDDYSMVEFYNADYAFATGTMGQLTPIYMADGRKIGNEKRATLFTQLSDAYNAGIPGLCERV